MQVIGQTLIDVLARGRRHKGRDDEVDVRQKEEDYHGDGGAERWCPRRWLAVGGEGVEVEVQEAGCYEDVDDGERVRDYAGDEVLVSGGRREEMHGWSVDGGLQGMNVLQDEIIGVARRRRKHDDDRDEPMFEESHERRIERLITSPEPRPGNDALPTDLLYDCRLHISLKFTIHLSRKVNNLGKNDGLTSTLREDNAQDVAKGRQGHEDGERALGAWTEHVAEKGGREDAAGADDLVFGHGGEIGDLSLY